ncbi:hypothetical protein ACWF94_27985 [Streptomyces sp. NPDC055078]
MTDQMKPPPRRRSGGRVLGGAKKPQNPAPPPAAELTRNQLAAEQSGAPGAGTTTAIPEVVQEPTPPAHFSVEPREAVDPVESSTEGGNSVQVGIATQSERPAEISVRSQPSELVAKGNPFPGATADSGSTNGNTPSEPMEDDNGRWIRGAGRPQELPTTAAVLNQRHIARESLDISAPVQLRLKKRLKRLALDNELDHLPLSDVVAVLLDEALTAHGF